MHQIPIKSTVVGSWPFPSWLEFASENLDKFGPADINEMIEDAVVNAIQDQVTAGLDVISDGEQTRLDFNLSFYGFIKGMQANHAETRKSTRYDDSTVGIRTAACFLFVEKYTVKCGAKYTAKSDPLSTRTVYATT